MKQLLLSLLMTVFCLSTSNAVEKSVLMVADVKNCPELQALSPELPKMDVNEFLSLTPDTYKAKTGKNLGVINTLKLKAAQKFVKQQMGTSSDISKEIYIVLAILGLGWLAMGLLDDWKGNDWIVNLVLTILCWLPGVIHAFVKMKKYFK